jgi:4-amino-4-deoxy-L-arabinose transferase-like glycosyltransferase
MHAHNDEIMSETAKGNRAPRIYMWSMVAILLVAAGLRVYALTADLPLHISLSQGATTDGPTTVLAGRNMVLFGAWNPFGEEKNFFYIFPAMSWISYATFRLLGVGLWQANLISVVAGLLAIVFMAAFAREQFGWRASLFTALFMTTNYLYLMYNRTSMVYTPLTCGLAMALYFWQRGLSRTGWFFLSGLVAGFSMLFIKIPGVALLPALLIGLFILARRRHRAGQTNVYKPGLFFGSGLLVSGCLWLLLIYVPESRLLNTHFTKDVHTFSAAAGLEENIRFALQSVLQFGIRSGFFLQMLPLFIVAYLYLFFRTMQALTSNRHQLPLAEIVALLYLLGVVTTFLASANRPTRYLIVLVPPMSLVAGLALENWLKAAHHRWPVAFSRWLPPLMMLSLTYFYYQLLAAFVKGSSLLRYRTGVADFRVISDGSQLFGLLGVGLVLGLATTLVFLWQSSHRRGLRVQLPPRELRLGLAILIVTSGMLIDAGQYVAWAHSPQFSILEASRQLEDDLGKGTILGGPYAYVLAIENRLPAILFYTNTPDEVVAAMPFTHLLVESDSLLENGPFNDQTFREDLPDLMQHTKLVRTYVLRGYTVKVYAVVRE